MQSFPSFGPDGGGFGIDGGFGSFGGGALKELPATSPLVEHVLLGFSTGLYRSLHVSTCFYCVLLSLPKRGDQEVFSLV